MSGFQHDIAGGDGNLVVTSVQSPNYSAGVSGWQVRKDGSAEFNNLTIRGTFNGTDFVINNSGAFFYSSTPAAGNLVASITNAGGTDSFGNNYVAGHATYGATFAASLNAGFVAFYTGSLAGGWTQGALIETDATGDLVLLAAAGRQVITANNTLDDGAGNMKVNGLTVGGSSNTGTGGPPGTVTGGPNGTGFFNTQGLASGAYGSTHQHTLPNFPTAAHTHDFLGHTHPL